MSKKNSNRVSSGVQKSLAELYPSLIRRHGRAILHINSLLQEEHPRVTPMLGAGVSRDLGFPTWTQLRDKLFDLVRDMENELPHPARHALNPTDDITRDIQLVYEIHKGRVQSFFDKRIGKQIAIGDENFSTFVDGQWINLLRAALYEKPILNVASHLGRVAAGFRLKWEELAAYYLDERNHAYLAQLVGLANKCEAVVTYNFDDVLELAINYQNKPNANFQTVTDARLPMTRGTKVIFHVNGYIPSEYDDRRDSSVVLTRSTFEDQLSDSMQGLHAYLYGRLLHTTCLLVGLSLNDPTLKHQLHRASQISPGHCHYLLAFCQELPSEAQRILECEANFVDYNLITIHLEKYEYAAFLDLVSKPPGTVASLFRNAGINPRQVYFLTGVSGIGKSTSAAYLKGAKVLDEWPSPPNPLLYKPWTELEDGERRGLDAWILLQMVTKNRLIDQESVGLIIVDRTPLDPLTYIEDWLEQSAFDKIRNYRASFAADSRLAGGAVISLS